MTTPDIPGAAVGAAHAAADACSFSHRPHGPWACCTEAALAAALPLLGETRTEYTVRITRDGRTYELDDCADTDRTRLHPERHRGYRSSAVIVQRPVWRGEWTEDTSE